MGGHRARPRRAQGARGAGPGDGAACATPTSTSARAARTGIRWSAGTRVPGSWRRSGPNVTRVNEGDHIVHLVDSRLRPLPLLLDRPPEHLQRRAQRRHRHDAGRHVPLPRERRGHRRHVRARHVPPVDRSSPRTPACRSTRTSPSRSPRWWPAASPPAGARRCTRPATRAGETVVDLRDRRRRHERRPGRGLRRSQERGRGRPGPVSSWRWPESSAPRSPPATPRRPGVRLRATRGEMADHAVITVGVMDAEVLAQRVDSDRQGRQRRGHRRRRRTGNTIPSTARRSPGGTRTSRARCSAAPTRCTTCRGCSACRRAGQLKLEELITNRYRSRTSTRDTRTCSRDATSAASSSTSTRDRCTEGALTRDHRSPPAVAQARGPGGPGARPRDRADLSGVCASGCWRTASRTPALFLEERGRRPARALRRGRGHAAPQGGVRGAGAAGAASRRSAPSRDVVVIGVGRLRLVQRLGDRRRRAVRAPGVTGGGHLLRRLHRHRRRDGGGPGRPGYSYVTTPHPVADADAAQVVASAPSRCRPAWPRCWPDRSGRASRLWPPSPDPDLAREAIEYCYEQRLDRRAARSCRLSAAGRRVPRHTGRRPTRSLARWTHLD